MKKTLINKIDSFLNIGELLTCITLLSIIPSSFVYRTYKNYLEPIFEIQQKEKPKPIEYPPAKPLIKDPFEIYLANSNLSQNSE